MDNDFRATMQLCVEMEFNFQMWFLTISKAFSDSLSTTTLHFPNLETCYISGMLEYNYYSNKPQLLL